MPLEQAPISNLDRLNRRVAPLTPMKKFALGGSVEELLVKPRNMLFPVPPPFLPSLGSGLRKPFGRPFGRPHN